MRRATLAFLLALSVLVPSRAYSQAATADAKAFQKQESQEPLRLSKHAQRRMTERGVSPMSLQNALKYGESFRYFHENRWKTGYYLAQENLFVATADGVVITIITGATRKYVQNLKKKSQGP